MTLKWYLETHTAHSHNNSFNSLSLQKESTVQINTYSPKASDYRKVDLKISELFSFLVRLTNFHSNGFAAVLFVVRLLFMHTILSHSSHSLNVPVLPQPCINIIGNNTVSCNTQASPLAWDIQLVQRIHYCVQFKCYQKNWNSLTSKQKLHQLMIL